jgi:hypothetical protein
MSSRLILVASIRADEVFTAMSPWAMDVRRVGTASNGRVSGRRLVRCANKQSAEGPNRATSRPPVRHNARWPHIRRQRP